jgi:hypothetical protein
VTGVTLVVGVRTGIGKEFRIKLDIEYLFGVVRLDSSVTTDFFTREAVKYKIIQDIGDEHEPLRAALAERVCQCIIVDFKAALEVFRGFLRGAVT